MRCKTTKLYPFSRKNIPTIKAYAQRFDETEEVTDEEIRVYALLHRMDEITDRKTSWLSGADIGYAKKLMASA